MAYKVALDAGHGLYTPGKRCMKRLDPNETREWILNSRIARYVEKYLQERDVLTMRVDDVTGKKDIALKDRCKAANDWGADIYMSIHANAGLYGKYGGGVASYSYPNSGRSAALRNRIYDEIIVETGLKGNRSNPKTTANFYVLRNTKMRACLVECGFMDSVTDVPIILTDAFARKCAKGIAKGLIKDLGLTWKEDVIDNPISPDKPQKPSGVYTGSSIVEYLKSIGVDSSKENRAKLAKQYGVANYDYSAKKNVELLNKMRAANNKPVKPNPPKPAVPSVPKPVKDKLLVDGWFGIATAKETQKLVGTVADGKVSRQPKANKKYLPNASENAWSFVTVYYGGSAMVKGLQTFLKKEGCYSGKVDGYFGQGTVIALQKFLKKKGYYTGKIDGSMGEQTVMAWQKYLNARK